MVAVSTTITNINVSIPPRSSNCFRNQFTCLVHIFKHILPQYCSSEISSLGRQYRLEVKGLRDSEVWVPDLPFTKEGVWGSYLTFTCLGFVLSKMRIIPTSFNEMFPVSWFYAWQLRIVSSTHWLTVMILLIVADFPHPLALISPVLTSFSGWLSPVCGSEGHYQLSLTF